MLVAMTNGYNQVASVDIISDALLMLAINRRLLQLKMDQQTLLLLKRIVIMCFFFCEPSSRNTHDSVLQPCSCKQIRLQ